MTGDGFRSLLADLRAAQREDDDHVSLSIRLGLRDADFDCFFTDATKIDCKPEYVVIRLTSADFYSGETLYVPYASILGVVQDKFSSGDCNFELVIQDELLRPLRAAYDVAGVEQDSPEPDENDCAPPGTSPGTGVVP